jgi:hypothetical protein
LIVGFITKGDKIMAGIITHLIIADEILKKIPMGLITNQDLFYAGSFAPDAIHEREGYIRADKKHTHLRDDILDKDFSNEENLMLFHNRVKDFITANIHRKGKQLDLYRGYVVHLLTDELFTLTVRQEFVCEMDKIGIAQNDRLFYTNILNDIFCIDFSLIKKYKSMEKIGKLLENMEPYSIDNYLTENELTRGRNWVLKNLFNQDNQNEEPLYISNERIVRFINEATQDIITRLSDGKMFLRML